MVYEAPRVTEVASVRDLTLGSNPLATYKDNSSWFGEWTQDPGPGSR